MYVTAKIIPTNPAHTVSTVLDTTPFTVIMIKITQMKL